MTFEKMDSLPAGNPFHHDLISVGMDLADATGAEELRGLYIMHAGRIGSGTYIVDSKTGERYQLIR